MQTTFLYARKENRISCTHVVNRQIKFKISSFSHFSFPGATNEALLQKFNSVHKDSQFYEKPQKKENAFIIRHYAGKVKYQVKWTDIEQTSKFIFQ